MSSNEYFNLIDFGSSKIRFSVYNTSFKEKYTESKSILLDDDYKNHFNFITDTVKRAEKELSYHIKDIILLLDSSKVFTIDIALRKKLDKKSMFNKVYESIILELNRLIYKYYDNYNIIHTIFDKCLIDDKIFDKLPENEIVKSDIKIDFRVVCLPSKLILNIKNKFNKKNLNILDIFCNSYIKSSSYSLKLDHKKISFLEIGWERTSLMFYENNKLNFIISIPIGSNHITKDISKVFNINIEEAEKLKRLFNKSENEFSYDKNESGGLISASDIIKKKNSIDILKKVILYRIQEIIDLIYENTNEKVNKNKFEDSELFLIGEGSKLLNDNSFYLEDKFKFNSIKFYKETDSQICKNGFIYYLNNQNATKITKKKLGLFEKFFNFFSN